VGERFATSLLNAMCNRHRMDVSVSVVVFGISAQLPTFLRLHQRVAYMHLCKDMLPIQLSVPVFAQGATLQQVMHCGTLSKCSTWCWWGQQAL